MFALCLTKRADEELSKLEKFPDKQGLVKQIKKTLGYLQINPRHPSLHTHVYSTTPNPYDLREKVFEAYAQNQTPSAYRIFWCYGPKKGEITIIAITPHP